MEGYIILREWSKLARGNSSKAFAKISVLQSFQTSSYAKAARFQGQPGAVIEESREAIEQE